MKIEIWRDLAKGDLNPDQVVEVGDDIPCRISLLMQADISDPLNQLRVLGFRCGKNFGGRISWGVAEGQDFDTTIQQLNAAVRALVIYATDNAAELRDHLKDGA